MESFKKSKIEAFFLTAIFASIFSAIYLQFFTTKASLDPNEIMYLEACVTERTFLPDVKFVKELLKAIFNAVS